jgi:hypothetical protein
MKTTVPAVQAEQIEDDVAPVTAEYLPAKKRGMKIMAVSRLEDIRKMCGHKTRTCTQSSQSMASPAGHEVTAEEPAAQ